MTCCRLLRSALLLLLMTATSACVVRASALGVDLNGQPVSELGGPGIRFVVLVFAASDCPISNRYVPEIARIRRQFAPQGVRIWWVFPNADDIAAKVAQHNHDFSITEDTILDPRQNLVRMAHAAVTPEAAVFAVRGEALDQIYRGRIDDRYASIGQERPNPNHHDLEAALDAALAGQQIPKAAGPPVGCSVVFLMR